MDTTTTTRYTIEKMSCRDGTKFVVLDEGICYNFYDTLEEAEAGKKNLEKEASIMDFIEESIEELEATLCTAFGVKGIPAARQLIKEYTGFGY